MKIFRNNPLFKFLTLCIGILMLSACEEMAPTPVEQNVTSGTGKNSIAVKTAVIPSGDPRCPNGGITVYTGIDTNGNGILDITEETSSQPVCNGSNGVNGTNGLDSLVVLTSEDPGNNCSLGGVKVTSGLDININSSLDENEITSTQFMCNGSSSNNTTTGNFDQAIYNALTAADTVNGGLLYDKWWKVSTTTAEPTANHTLWPASNTAIQGSGTWRCKECHGWDYRGRDGAYQSGSHFTGFAGVVNTRTAAMTRTTPESVFAFLSTDLNHGFSDSFFTDQEYYSLTKFIMQIRDEATNGTASYNYISSEKQAIGSNNINGKTLFENAATCSLCHGLDGKAIDFEDNNLSSEPNAFVHNIAQDNPWEFIHKVRFGQPGSAMTGLALNTNALSNIQSAVDILGYAQTSLAPDVKRAGLLYDKWWRTEGVTTSEPLTRNPSWVNNPNATQDPTLVPNSSTWRCASCHGWDYLGVNGTFGNTNDVYYTGIPGFTNAKNKSKNELVAAIASGTCNNCDANSHSYSLFLSADDIALLADFILALPSTTAYQAALNSTDVVNGKTVYQSGTPGHCENCHGADGTAIPTADVSVKANANPQEFLHKIQYGQPGTFMQPPIQGFMGLSLEQAGQVLAYAKTIGSGNSQTASYEFASVQRGGRLYDKWWVEMQATNPAISAPTGINPFYTDGQNSGGLPALAAGSESNSWRCKTCHGWDYKGVGYFTSGIPTSTGADNLLYKVNLRNTGTFPNNPTALQNHFFNWVKNGDGITGHQFGTVTTQNSTPLNDQDVWDIVKFLLEGGVINTENNILTSGAVIGVNLTNGQGLYNGSASLDINCSVCHGVNGNTPPPPSLGGSGLPLDIFAIAAANDDPWEFVHKTRFGQPGTPMPGTIGIPSLSDQDALDILGYAQQQFINR